MTTVALLLSPAMRSTIIEPPAPISLEKVPADVTDVPSIVTEPEFKVTSYLNISLATDVDLFFIVSLDSFFGVFSQVVALVAEPVIVVPAAVQGSSTCPLKERPMFASERPVTVPLVEAAKAGKTITGMVARTSAAIMSSDA